MAKKIRPRIAGVIGLAILVSSCSFANTISSDAVDYNSALENAANQAILSNVLRAKDRKPLHFTALSQIRGNLKLQGQAGVSAEFPFNGDSALPTPFSKVTPSASLTYSTNPSFDVAVLDSEKFMNGLLSPIKMEVLDHYWQQGWPRELLLHMFIRKIDFSNAIKIDGKPVHDVENIPGNRNRMKQFQIFIKWLIKRGIRTGKSKSADDIGPPVHKDKINLEQLVKAAEQKLSVDVVKKNGKDTDDYQLKRPSQSITFCVDLGPKSSSQGNWVPTSAVIDLKNRTCKKKVGNNTKAKGISTQGLLQVPQEIIENINIPKYIIERPGEKTESLELIESQQQPDGKDKDDMRMLPISIPGETYIVFYIRSVESMIYYLGELAREIEYADSENDKSRLKRQIDRAVKINVGSDPEPLFLLTEEKPDKGFEVGVSYGSASFGIPRDVAQAGRSMHVLSLVGQLLALQKSADEIPSTRAVTLLGP